MRARLEARRPEIEQAILARLYSVSELTGAEESQYVEGMREAVSAALSYGLAVIELGEERTGPLPTALLTQARLAARSGVSLDTVLRRYLAGYTLLGDFLIQEARAGALLKGVAMQRVARAQAAVFDRLIAAVAEEYGREARGHITSPERRRVERIEGLLAGELLDTSELGYEFDVWHVGLVATGAGVCDGIRLLASQLDRRALLVDRGEGTVWAWLGGRRPLAREDLEHRVSTAWPKERCLALGEPAHGLSGWRFTHQQASAAFPIALRNREVVRYADVAVLASSLQDDVLVGSLVGLFVSPLGDKQNGGDSLRETLRSYFAAGRQVSSAASALGVSRQTVAKRLRAVEDRVGRSLDDCAIELELALRLESLKR